MALTADDNIYQPGTVFTVPVHKLVRTAALLPLLLGRRRHGTIQKGCDHSEAFRSGRRQRVARRVPE